MKKNIILGLTIFFLMLGAGCGGVKEKLGLPNKEEIPEITLPASPMERAAVQGLISSYKDSTMWEVKEVTTLKVQPMAPSRSFLDNYDPKELYCVCLEYQARYKVPWTTSEASSWERTVRNVLVMKTQSNQYMSVRPVSICNPMCE